ncbi:hypothetical protein ACFXTO_046865 [Malus domestica]
MYIYMNQNKQSRGSLHKGCSGEVSAVSRALERVGIGGDHSEPQYWAEPQKEEALKVNHLELHYAVHPQKTKVINAFGTNPQTSDDQVKSDHQIPAAGQASSSCL